MPQSMKIPTSKLTTAIGILAILSMAAGVFSPLYEKLLASSSLPAAWVFTSVLHVFERVTALLCALFLALLIRQLNNFRKYVRSKQGRLCPKCHYPTPGDLAEGQRCSECGVVFSGWMIRDWNEMWKPKSSEMKAEIPAEKTD